MVQMIKIMISSTRLDLVDYRRVTGEVIRQLNDEKDFVKLNTTSMEKNPQSGEGETAIAVSKRWVEESNWVILIVGFNYGTIPSEAEAEGLSITEWEYRHASEIGKKIFVFVVGDPNSLDEYKQSAEEKVNLMKYEIEALDEARQKLTAFKNKLRSRHLNFFHNLSDFREKLTRTLRESIDALPPSIPEGALAELILALQDPIKQGISDVKLLVGYKTIHDLLHEIRNKVIKPLREVRPKWENDRNLTPELVLQLSSKVQRCCVLQETIRNTLKEISSVKTSFLKDIEAVVSMSLLKENNIPTFDTFFMDVDDFASNVQFAFTDANDLMQEQVRLLDKFLDNLHPKIKQAISKSHLTPEESESLNSKLQQIEQNKERFFAVLNGHNKWQKLHDELEEIDSFKDSKSFETKLKRFCNNRANTLLEITDEETQRVRNSRETDDIAAVKGLERLRTSWPALNSTVPLESPKILENYEGMRNEFDAVFYHVDKHTLAEVYCARDCVVDCESVLYELNHNRKRGIAGS
jgi:hypothetical protein